MAVFVGVIGLLVRLMLLYMRLDGADNFYHVLSRRGNVVKAACSHRCQNGAPQGRSLGDGGDMQGNARGIRMDLQPQL